VIKKRSGNHEHTIREFKLDGQAKGIRIGEPLKEFQGILTGVPRFEGKPDKMMRSSE
jgi:circadian clock protein KaiC